nr:MAG TPA: hypothetical protein [Crassvirales sp.]
MLRFLCENIHLIQYITYHLHLLSNTYLFLTSL